MENCPICQNSNFTPVLKTRDHFFSQEEFYIIQCEECGFRITDPIPPQEEIGQYYNSENYVSHNSSAKGFINRIYTFAQDFNFYLKYRALKKYVPRGTWMDYGAGNGAFVSYLKSKGIEAYGYEPSKSAREHSSVSLKDISNYPHDKNHYSCITMWHVLEHIHNLNELLQQHHDHLSAEGLLVIAVPNIDSCDSEYYGSNWAALDTPRHLWHFTEKDIKSLLAKKGFEHVVTKGMPLDSYYVSLLSEKYKKGLSLRAPIIGLFSNIMARLKQYPFSSQIYIFRKNQA